LGRGEVELLICDMGLPGISGLELLQRARQTNPGVVALMITGLATPEIVASCKQVGAYGCFSKPINAFDVLAICDQALASAAAPRAAAADASRSVLIVGDSDANAEQLSGVCADAGLEAPPARTAVLAMELV